MQGIKARLAEYRPILFILYLAFAGTACVVSAQLYLGAPPHLGLAAVCLGIIFSVYTLNRFTDLREDFANDTARVIFFTHRQTLKYLAVGSLVFCGGYLATAGKLGLYHFLLISLGLVYSYPLVPWLGRDARLVFLRLKQITLVKNIIVAVLWGASVFAMPLLFVEGSQGFHFNILLLSGAFTISTFNNTFFSDIRDRAGDLLAGNKTFPVVYGETNSYRFLAAVNTLWFGAVAFLFWHADIDLAHFAVIGALAAYPLVYVLLHVTRKAGKAAIDLLSELDIAFIAVGLAALSLL